MRCLLLAFAALLLACPGGPDGPGGPGDDDAPGAFDEGVTRLRIEIDYAPGAEPYTGSVGTSSDVWTLTQTNLEALLAETAVVVDVPHELSGMEELSGVTGDAFTVSDILDLADQHRDGEWDAQTATLYAIWLDGNFADDSGVRDSVLGVSIGDTGVIAMFKPVIEGLGTGPGPLGETVRKFGEQTTFIHEVGHALGLVNNGLPLTSDHHDEENGAHCTNDRCVMYWANEGAGDLAEFVQDYVLTGDTVVFAQDCLDDAAAASP